MSRCIALVVALAGCGRLSFDAVRASADASGGDGDTMLDSSDAPAAGCPVSWQQTAMYPELNMGGSSEDPSVTADRLQIVFSTTTSSMGGKDIWWSSRATTSDPWNAPVNLLVLNSTVDDAAPELTADGQRIYFASDRGGGTDVWRSSRVADSWSAPEAMTALNLANAGELELAVSPDELTALVNRDAHMMLFTRPTTADMFAGDVERTELRVTTDVASPSLTSGAVYFHAGAVRDLYVACRNSDNTFQAPVPIAGLNTSNRDADPFVLEGDAVMFYQCQQDICEATPVP